MTTAREPVDESVRQLHELYLKPLFRDHADASCPAGAATVESIVQELGAGAGLERLALDLLDGRPMDDPRIGGAAKMKLLNGWLRLMTGDSGLARMRWSALAASRHRELRDRDAYLLALWRRVENDAAGEGGLVEYARARWCPWEHYERHMFGWFLSRLDVVRAREVFGPSRRARWLDWILLPGALGLAVFALLPGLDPTRSFFALLAAVAGLGLLYLWAELPGYAYLASLIPRLAATVGIGYLFLLNAPQIARYVCELPRRGGLWLATGVLVLTALAYVMLHVSRRVHPAPRPAELLRRSLRVLALAVSYAALGLVAAAPVLFSRTVMGATEPIEARHLALVAAIALNLGVVLQLAWDEKPLTEPL